jgi:hypothetical protein
VLERFLPVEQPAHRPSRALANTEPDTHTHTHTDADTHAHPDSDANANANANPDTEPVANPVVGHGRAAACLAWRLALGNAIAIACARRRAATVRL